MRLLLAVAALGAAKAAKAPASAQYAALRPALDEIASLRAHVDGGACVPDLGAKADALCAAAEERVKESGGDAKAVRDVEKRLDALLRSIYAKQLRTARAAAVQAFRRAKLGGEYDALIKAREEFTALAEAASRAEWTYDDDERELETTPHLSLSLLPPLVYRISCVGSLPRAWFLFSRQTDPVESRHLLELALVLGVPLAELGGHGLKLAQRDAAVRQGVHRSLRVVQPPAERLDVADGRGGVSRGSVRGGFPVLGGRGRERVVCARDLVFVARGEDVGGGHSARGLHVFAIDLRLDHAEYILGVVGVVIRGGGHAGVSSVRSESAGSSVALVDGDNAVSWVRT